MTIGCTRELRGNPQLVLWKGDVQIIVTAVETSLKRLPCLFGFRRNPIVRGRDQERCTIGLKRDCSVGNHDARRCRVREVVARPPGGADVTVSQDETVAGHREARSTMLATDGRACS